MLDLTDEKLQSALATIVGVVIVQVSTKYGFQIDQATANVLSLAIVVIGATLIGGHAHVQNAETHADAHVEATKIENSPAPPASKS